MNNNEQDIKWSENVILVDADYVDKVAFNLIVNFERMLGRRIPQADMARWLECIALDGGLRKGDHETQVVFIHQKAKTEMENFVPGNYSNDLTDKAFQGELGEFMLNAYPIEAIADGDEVSIDFQTGVIEDLTTGISFQARAFPAFIQNIIDHEGLMNSIKE